MKKRVLSLLIALCLVLSLVPAVSAEEATSGTCGENLTWRYEEYVDPAWALLYRTLYIEGEGAMDDYTLDENGNTTAPWNKFGFDEIVVDPGVTYIGEYAFYARSPYAIDLYQTGVTEIGSHAFASDSNCSEVILPAGLTGIEDGLFQNDAALTTVYIPDGVISIGNGSFAGTGVTNLSIPEAVSSVGAGAFEGMPGPIWFNGDVPAFAADTFDGYTGTIYYPADDPAWAEAAAQNAYGSHIWLPNPQYSGTCGENLTWTLDGCTLYIEGEGDMYDYAWDTHAPWYELSFRSLELGSGVTSIGSYAFYKCRDLLRTNLGESHVTRIGMYAFSYTNLFLETLPEGVTALEGGTFYGTSSLRTVSLPESLESIGGAVFHNSGLKELTIPRNVRSMGGSVFYYVRNAVIRFTGDAPELTKGVDDESFDTFEAFQGTIYYPGNNPTWTDDIVNRDDKWHPWVPYILNPFTDVPEDSFYYDPVMWAIEHNITNGLTETTFGPTATCNRAQVVTFLWRAAGSPEPTSTENPFVDVQAGSFYEKPVLWAVENNITNGSDATHFNPNGVCNRAQVVTFLFRAFGSPAVENADNPFTDVPAGSFYEAPVLWAVENGITNGLSATTFGPNESCNRAQVVTFLYRAYTD